MPYNPLIHHRRSIRLKGYDYAQPGLYFITVCTENRECIFGHVANGQMVLNEAGQVADACWQSIPSHFPTVRLHPHVIMPNHVHGILEITDDGGCHVGAENFLPSVFLPSVVNLPLANNLPHADNTNLPHADNTNLPHAGNTEWPENFLPLPPPPQPSFQHVIPRSIPSIVRGFKIGVSKWYREQFGARERSIWQRNYYEHIIRDDAAMLRISEYIQSNPALWLQDRFYSS